MTENMKKWLELVSADEELRNGLMALNDLPRDEAVRGHIAKAAEKGIVLTEEEFEVPGNRELSDDELDAVAAGNGCGCAVLGGGNGVNEDTKEQYICACVAGGGGKDSCLCLIAGAGVDCIPDDYNAPL